jgi:hypothetical protein
MGKVRIFSAIFMWNEYPRDKPKHLVPNNSRQIFYHSGTKPHQTIFNNGQLVTLYSV